MLAVIETGGKQYLISSSQNLMIEKIQGVKEGDALIFDKVLLFDDGKGTVKIGNPYLKGVAIEAKAEKIGKRKKIMVFRYHNKTRYKKKKGHRQPYLRVKIRGEQ